MYKLTARIEEGVVISVECKILIIGHGEPDICWEEKLPMAPRGRSGLTQRQPFKFSAALTP